MTTAKPIVCRLLIAFSTAFFTHFLHAQQVTTFAGLNSGYVDGIGTNAKFRSPYGLAFDALGNLYVSDHLEDKIRKISPLAEVTTFAGSTTGFADGTAFNAKFESLGGIAFDTWGTLYVADIINGRIRKVTSTGDVSTFAGSGDFGYKDGIGSTAVFNIPYAIAVDHLGNCYVADYNNNRIRKISGTGDVSTFAGSGAQGSADGTGTAAEFNRPTGVACDMDGNVYVADFMNHTIRKITRLGEVSTLAGSTMGYADGIGSAAQFNYPRTMAIDPSGTIYLTESGNNRIRKITAAGVVSTIAGSGVSGYLDGNALEAKFDSPYGIAIDAAGNLFVADSDNRRIRKITLSPIVTGLGEATKTNLISVHPNPATTKLHVKSSKDITSIEVWDMTGRKIPVSMSDNTTIDLSPLNEGIYFLHFTIGDQIEIHKFLKTR